jgi:hypothetical protein
MIRASGPPTYFHGSLEGGDGPASQIRQGDFTSSKSTPLLLLPPLAVVP